MSHKTRDVNCKKIKRDLQLEEICKFGILLESLFSIPVLW